MATIKTTDTNKTYEYRMDCDTQDVLDEIIGNSGNYYECDEDGAWLMDEDDALWWVAYGIREDAIESAREMDPKDEDDMPDPSDLEALQWGLCRLYGIDYDKADTQATEWRVQPFTRVSVNEDAAYEIVIEDADESCDEVLLSETFAGEAEANARYAELREEFLAEDGGWRDGLNLWLFEDGESVDGESK